MSRVGPVPQNYWKVQEKGNNLVRCEGGEDLEMGLCWCSEGTHRPAQISVAMQQPALNPPRPFHPF